MAHIDDSSSLNAESPLKRKAISECRLQDPKIWTKISWIRTNFIKDLKSGVRKIDFYNYVTEHLGKTGYRDVWHLLKIAYPHVERVRRGRKYMYWGVRHADEQVHCELKDDGNNGEDEDEDNQLDQDKEFIGEESFLRMEIEEFSEGRSENQMNELNSSEEPSESKTPLSEDTKSTSGFLVKLEKDPNIDEQKPDDVVVIEFKDKEVFASFEDYEKSIQTADENGNLIKIKGKKTRGNQNKKEGERRTVARSVSPPLEIFSFESLKDDDKIKILDLSSTPKDHHDNDELKGDRKDHRQVTSLKHEHCHGDSDNGPSVSKEPENGSLSNSQEGNVSREKPRREFAPSLLYPENINRMCMPLIKDLGNKNTNKTRSVNENNVNDTTANEQPNDMQDNNIISLSANDTDSNGDNEAGINGKFPCHPLIVSVTSIAGVEDSYKGPDQPSSDEINNILKASQLQSCKSVTARLDVNDETTRKSPSSPNDTAEFVVVQDRGIQVTEQIHTCNQLGKRNFKQSKASVCQKPSHSSLTDHTSRKLLSPNSSNICPQKSIPVAGNKGQGVQIVPSSQDRPRVWLSGPSIPSSGRLNRTSTRPDSSNVHGQPRPAMAASRNSSQSVTSGMGNIVRSEEPLMKALMKKPPSYHALVVKTRNSPDRMNYPSVPEQKRLLPKKVISTDAVNNLQQDRLSPKYGSSQNVVYGTTSPLEHRPSLTLPHGQQEKQLFDQNINKTRGSTNQLSSYNERNNDQRPQDRSSSRTQDFLRNLLSNCDSKSNPSTNTSTSDLQVTVECLSSELEKERTMRLRLEIELRKVENQLKEERKLNERLAALLMKR